VASTNPICNRLYQQAHSPESGGRLAFPVTHEKTRFAGDSDPSPIKKEFPVAGADNREKKKPEKKNGSPFLFPGSKLAGWY
jgi:hypothetical protein